MEIKMYKRNGNYILNEVVDERAIEIYLNAGFIKNPQELIQVGDLVELENDALTIKIEVINMRLKHLQSCHLEYNLDMFTITKIYTPNKDKSQYTLQWEVNNE